MVWQIPVYVGASSTCNYFTIFQSQRVLSVVVSHSSWSDGHRSLHDIALCLCIQMTEGIQAESQRVCPRNLFCNRLHRFSILSIHLCWYFKHTWPKVFHIMMSCRILLNLHSRIRIWSKKLFSSVWISKSVISSVFKYS